MGGGGIGNLKREVGCRKGTEVNHVVGKSERKVHAGQVTADTWWPLDWDGSFFPFVYWAPLSLSLSVIKALLGTRQAWGRGTLGSRACTPGQY